LEEIRSGNKEKEELKNKLAKGDPGAAEDPTTGLWKTVSRSFGLEPLSSLSSSRRPYLTR